MKDRSSIHVLVVDYRRDANGCVGGLGRYGFRITHSDDERVVADAERLKPDAIVIRVSGAVDRHVRACRTLVTGRRTRRIPLIAIAGEPPEREYMIVVGVSACRAAQLARTIVEILSPTREP